MGTWGPGLYANDLAKDLKATISSVLKLPLSPAELVGVLEEAFPGPSREVDDEDYTSFWLVLADQFHKSGIDEPTVFQRAAEIIASGRDLQCPQRLEMTNADRRKRAATLEELLQRLRERPEKKVRKTLTKPQSLLMGIGDVMVFPTYSHGNCRNPYSARWSHEQEGWGAACIVRAGHVFGYLAYYYPLVLGAPFGLSDKPALETLRPAGSWELRRPGTCSKLHYSRMQLEVAGEIAVDEEKLSAQFSDMRDGRYQAVNDVSIADALTGVTGCDGSVETLQSIAASR